MNCRKPKFNSYAYLFSALLATVAKDPIQVVLVSNFIRESDLSDTDKNNVLDLFAVSLSKLSFNDSNESLNFD